ncbi:unnamed protein product [Amoebophrya sp. A120]|nr:unnamed protein product [Amoebophrya sp. A120]|eukprot:GSA120T00025900001.1
MSFFISRSTPPVSMRRASTPRLTILNIRDIDAAWWQLRNFITEKTGIYPQNVNIIWGMMKSWATVEFDTVEEAQQCIDKCDEQEFRGAIITVRQDREDRSLEIFCTDCRQKRKCAKTGFWYRQNQWYCSGCTVFEELRLFPIFDTNTHLEYIMDKQFYYPDEEIAEAVAALPLKTTPSFSVITCCTKLDQIDNCLRLVKNGQGHVLASFGTHPKNALYDWDENMAAMMMDAVEKCRRENGEKSVVAWGETGLDFAGYEQLPDQEYVRSTIEKQKLVFQENIAIAKKLQVPLKLHSRDCERDFLEFIERNLDPDYPFHWHAVIASIPAILRCLARFSNCYFGICGAVCFPYADDWDLPNQLEEGRQDNVDMTGGTTSTTTSNIKLNLYDMVKAIPLDRILLETDAPNFATKTGSPADVLEIANYISWLKEVKVEEVIRVTSENAFKLYGVRAKERDAGNMKSSRYIKNDVRMDGNEQAQLFPSRYTLDKWKEEKKKEAAMAGSGGRGANCIIGISSPCSTSTTSATTTDSTRQPQITQVKSLRSGGDVTKIGSDSIFNPFGMKKVLRVKKKGTTGGTSAGGALTSSGASAGPNSSGTTRKTATLPKNSSANGG